MEEPDEIEVMQKEFEGNRSILLNIGGFRFETLTKTLLKYPKTKLGRIADSSKRTGRREFFFDRDHIPFSSILNYYRTGTLHIPTNLCGPSMRSEMDFWEIEDSFVEECCWINYTSFEETKKVLDKFVENKKCLIERKEEMGYSWSVIKPKLWSALKEPYSSRGALVFAACSTLLVFLSLIVFVLESMPQFGHASMNIRGNNDNKTVTSSDLRDAMNIFHTDSSRYHSLLIVDNICNLFFFAELILGFISAPSKIPYVYSAPTLLEIFCIVPYYIAIAVVYAHPEPRDVYFFVQVLLAFRVLRIFRIFKLMSHFQSLSIIVHTIWASMKELFLLVVLVLTGVIIFGCLEYYAELITANETDFEHIPVACWWALVTMTTVGYGDIVPKSWLGHLIGSVCVISGVLVIALSLSVIVNNFTVLYFHAQSRSALKHRECNDKSKERNFQDGSHQFSTSNL